MQFNLHEAVEVTVVRNKAIGTSGDTFRMTGKCMYRVSEPAEKAELTIELDKPTFKFKSKNIIVLSIDSGSYRVTNKRPITRRKFKVLFTVQYIGAEIPAGNCSDLEIITQPEEIFQNNDMEMDFTDNWFGSGSSILQTSTDSYSGSQSAMITNRTRIWEGLSQFVNLTGGSRYSLHGYIKLLNVETAALYHTVHLMLICSNDQGDKEYMKFGTNLMTQPGIWTEIGAVRVVPEGYDTYKAYFGVEGMTVDYVADQMSIFEIPDIEDLESKTAASIDRIRKADISIRFTNEAPLPQNLSIEILQTKHDFPFGSVVGSVEIVSTDPVYQKYQEFFYDNFDWATVNNVIKWKGMERVQGVIDYERPYKALTALRDRGIRVRAQNMFWGFEKWTPDWVLDLPTKEDLMEAMSARINGTMGNTTGLIDHWLVMNENQHGDYYERTLSNPNITMKLFHDMHAVDGKPKLFVNDYGIVEDNGNLKATAVKEQVELFKAVGVPVYGIGVQSHIKPRDVDITSMKARLDKVAETGLPLWITELSVEEKDENLKAKALEDVLNLYFSHPAVEGINIWGYWEGRIWKPDMVLVDADMTPNAAGRVYQTLYKQTWRTQETINIVDDSTVYLRGFKGAYTVNVKQNDQLLTSKKFVLRSSGKVLDITIP